MQAQPMPEVQNARYVRRFWAKIDVRGPDDCWEWVRFRDPVGGYGKTGWSGKIRSAHRVAWCLIHGDPGELQVLHRCDNPPCRNPAHLFLGTDQDNVDDKMAKGRHFAGKGNARLTSDDVRAIRAAVASGETATRVAPRFGISQPHASRIVRGECWAHIT